MAEKGGIHKILTFAPVYSFYQWMVGAEKMRRIFVNEYIKPAQNEKILDLGCGTADICNHFPKHAEYHGVDPNQSYIAHAKARYGSNAKFWIAGVNENEGLTLPSEMPVYNCIINGGVLHHLNDKEADLLLKTARKLCEAGNGRFVVIDNCYTENQGRIAKWLADKDRGAYMRFSTWHETKLREYFSHVQSDIRTDLYRIPVTMFAAVCTL